MNESTRSSIINLPLKVALTESGSNYFIKNKKELVRLKLIDSNDRNGIELSKVSLEILQRIIILNYVSKIEVSAVEFNSDRATLVDLSKIIIFSKMYQQFNSAITKTLLSFDCVKKHNRSNPSKFLDENLSFNDELLEKKVKDNQEIKYKIFSHILKPVHDEISSSKTYTSKEKKSHILMTEKFLNRMNYFNWYLLLLFSNHEEFNQMIAKVREVIFEYIPKSSIAEYVALLLIELCTNIETTNFLSIAKTILGNENLKSSILLDSKIRNAVLEEAKKRKKFIYVSWKVGQASNAIGNENNVKISVYGKDANFKEIKSNIDSKKYVNLNRNNLIDFYTDIPKGDIGSDLGLYYVSYLDEECKKVNVKFTTNVKLLEDNNLSVIDLNFKF